MVVVVTRCLRCDDGCMIDGLMWGSADECRLKCDDDIRAFCIWPIFTEIKKKKKKRRSCRVRACLAVRRFRLPRPRAGARRRCEGGHPVRQGLHCQSRRNPARAPRAGEASGAKRGRPHCPIMCVEFRLRFLREVPLPGLFLTGFDIGFCFVSATDKV